MENLLVLNGSHSDIPLIKAGKKLGFRVITTGNRPDLIGHRYADEYICCDFSDPVAVYDTFKDRHISAVCSCANDFGAITAAYLAEKLGLPGHDTYENALTIHHKDRFKRFAADIGLHTPKAVSFSELSGAIAFEPESYPFMVKPIDLTGGKGVSKVYDRGEYEAAVKLAFDLSPSGRIVAEPFIEGTQHSFSTFLIGGRVRAYFSDNEYSYLNKFLVSTSAGPATKVDCAKDILISDAEKTAKALDLKDGVFHYQYILSENNEPFILEITRRCSGDIYPEPVEHATGIKWAENIVRAECGMECEFPSDSSQKGFCGRHCVMGDREGIVKEIQISDEIRNNIYDSFMWNTEGFSIKNRYVDKAGIMFLEYGSEAEMLDKVSRITDLIKIVYE